MIKSQRRWFVAVITVMLSLALVISGCGSGGGSDSNSNTGSYSTSGTTTGGNKSSANETETREKVTLEYWSTPIADQEGLENIIKKYTTEVAPHVEIKLTYLPYNGIDEKVNVAVAAETFPDVYSDATQRLGPLAIRNVTAPLDDYIDEAYNLDDFFEGTIELSKINGKIYMFMFDNIPQVLMINKTLFEQAGAADLLPDPQTRAWSRAQFEQAVEKIGSLGGGIYGFGIGAGAVDHDKYIDGFIYSDGDEYTDETNTKITYNSEVNIRNLEWLRKVATSPAAVPGTSGNNLSNIFELFKQGKVGIMNFGSGYLETIQKGLADGTIQGPLEVMYALFPTEDGSVGKTFSYSAAVAIKQQDDARKMEEAANFAKWLTSGQDELVNEVFFKTAGRLPARKSLQDLIEDPEKKMLAGMADKLIRNIFIIPNYNQIRKVWFNNFQPVFIDALTPEAALANYEQEAQKLLDEGNEALKN